MKLVALLFMLFGASFADSDVVFCYFTNWAIYRSGPAKYSVSDVDPSLCTILNYAFIGLWGENGTVRVLDEYSDIDRNQIADLVALKQTSDVKVIVSMGGWGEGSTNYSIVAASPEKRKNFVNSVIDFIEEHGFDGFDLDWEYPRKRGGASEDNENFVILLEELQAAFKPKGYLLTVAVLGAGYGNITNIYIVPRVSNAVDYINLMEYDLRTPSEVDYVIHHSPLFPSVLDDTELNKNLSVSRGLNAWLELGANRSKILLGVAFYGHSFTLADPSRVQIYDPVSGPGAPGPYTATGGFVSYQEICMNYTQYNYIFDEEQQVPHIYLDDQWIGYDDPRSLTVKSNFAKQNGLGGIMMWALDYDDFNNSCGNGRYPLLRAINSALGRSY